MSSSTFLDTVLVLARFGRGAVVECCVVEKLKIARQRVSPKTDSDSETGETTHELQYLFTVG